VQVSDVVINSIEVFNTLGEKISTTTIPNEDGTVWNIDILDEAPGIYLIKVNGTDEFYTAKIIYRK